MLAHYEVALLGAPATLAELLEAEQLSKQTFKSIWTCGMKNGGGLKLVSL